jgi:hypothetical protein
MDEKIGFGSEDERLKQILQILRFDPDDEACQDCLSQLEDYIAAQFAGEDYMTRFPRVVVHLDACSDCAGAYARLYELELAEANGTISNPEQIPEPDLGFLQGGSQKLHPSVSNNLTKLIQDALRRTGDRILVQFSAELLDLLRPLPSATPVRAPTESDRYHEVIVQLNPDHFQDFDFPITLTAYRDSQQPESCLVEVRVEPPGESWPDLEGRSVTLIVAEERIESLTDAWGVASFESIRIDDLAGMKLEIDLAD